MVNQIALAPLMGYTDVGLCKLMRLIAPGLALTTEMIHANAVLHSNKHTHFEPIASQCAIQLGGSEPALLAQAALRAEAMGFNAINLNVGCPSERVQKGVFGACLMREPCLVAECVSAIKQAVCVPVTVKCRIGVDEDCSDQILDDFIKAIVDADVDCVIIHARAAWLKGLNPKQNRTIPPLDYDKVYRFKQRYPTLPFIINGGITSIDQVDRHLQHVDGVMIGRWALADPWAMRQLDQHIHPEQAQSWLSREEVVRAYLNFVQSDDIQKHYSSAYMLRHLPSLAKNCSNAKAWRHQIANAKVLNDFVIDNLVKTLPQSS